MKTFWHVLWFLSGILEIAAGIFCILSPQTAMLGFVYFLGVSVLLYGVSTTAYYCAGGRRFIGSFWVLLDGILSAVLGCVVLFTGGKLALAAAMPYIFGIWMACKGLVALAHSFDARKLRVDKWYLLTIFGAFCVVLGVLSFIQPVVGAATFAVLVGLYFIFSGALALAQWTLGGVVRRDLKNLKKDLEDGVEITIENGSSF